MQIKMATIFFVGVVAPIGALSTSGSRRSHSLTLEKFNADLIMQNPDKVFAHHTYVQEFEAIGIGEARGTNYKIRAAFDPIHLMLMQIQERLKILVFPYTSIMRPVFFLGIFVCSQSGYHPQEDGEKVSTLIKKIYPNLVRYQYQAFSQ